MSEPSRSSRGRSMRGPAGPFGQLIADRIRALGMSRSEAAAAMNATMKGGTFTASIISRWIHNGVIPMPVSQRAIAAGLHVPKDELDAAIAAQVAQQEAERITRQLVSGAEKAATPVDSDDVKRRDFGKLVALAATSAATGIDLDRFAAVLAGTRVDEPALNDIESLTLDLVGREATLAPNALMPAVRGHLTGLRDALVWTSPALAPRAQSLAGQTALLAGYLMFKQDNPSEADLYWSLAERFGDRAGDVRLRAALLVLRAQLSEAESWPQEGANASVALSFLDRAMSLLGPDPDPAVAAHVLTFRARAHAEASHADAAAADRALRDLEVLHAYLGRMPSPDGSVYIVESVRGEAVQKGAMALVHLGRAADAVPDLERLLDSIDHASLSWRAGVTANLAAAHAAQGEPEHACELLGASLRLASRASAPRAINHVRNARHRWLADYDGPPVRSLDDELSGALSSLPAQSGNPHATLS